MPLKSQKIHGVFLTFLGNYCDSFSYQGVKKGQNEEKTA
jgi:hypothetical protein